MILTGQCKIDFEKWYRSNRFKHDYGLPLNDIAWETIGFESLGFSCQYGVLVDFFDEHKLIIKIEGFYCFGFVIIERTEESIIPRANNKEVFNTRNEARQKAIEKANQIYNQTIR